MPIPYPNIAQPITRTNGTAMVKGDKAMAAIKGSKLAMSNRQCRHARWHQVQRLHEEAGLDPLFLRHEDEWKELRAADDKMFHNH